MDVRRVQNLAIRIILIYEGVERAAIKGLILIYEGVERAGIKGTVYKKTCRLPTHRDPRKLKKSFLKRRPRSRRVIPRLLLLALIRSMHLGFSSLLTQILAIMSI